MDGLLLDTEDLYTVVTNEILHEYGKPDLPWRIKAQLQGRPGPEANRIFHEWAELPISESEYAAKNSKLQRRYFSRAQPLPGVPNLLTTLKNTSDPHIQMAVATSSHTEPYNLKTLNNKGLFSVFEDEYIVKGDDLRVKKGRGKPAPDIYLLALQIINHQLKKEGKPEIKPAECLVFEDAVPGVEAGRRAGMQVVWCPHPGLLAEFKGREKQVLAGLMGEHKDEENTQVPGAIDDGWARLVPTLENFPYQSYGINV